MTGKRRSARGTRALGLGATVALLTTAGAILLAWQALGFPDGHLTELDRARQVSYPLSALGATGAAVVVGWVTFKRPQRLRIAVLAALAALALIALADGWLAAAFDSGQGG